MRLPRTTIGNLPQLFDPVPSAIQLRLQNTAFLAKPLNLALAHHHLKGRSQHLVVLRGDLLHEVLSQAFHVQLIIDDALTEHCIFFAELLLNLGLEMANLAGKLLLPLRTLDLTGCDVLLVLLLFLGDDIFESHQHILFFLL